MAALKKYCAEFIGTFVLVVFGCGTAAVTGCATNEVNVSYFVTALAFGLVIVAMAYSIGNVSGCHINPAVSIAMLVSKKMSVVDFCGYVVAQCLGAIAGAGVLYGILKPEEGLGANGLYDNNIGISFVVEIILTFVFVLAILGVTSKIANGAVAGIVIGLTLTLVHIFGIHFTGTSVNPARSLGPALLTGGDALANVWVFLLAPLVGGVLAALVYMFLAGDQKEEPVAEVKSKGKKK